jgi:hypothetical protein
MAERLRQTAFGTQNVQQVLGAGARAEVHYHADQLTRPAPPDASALADAEALFAQMPLDRVPELGPLPRGSRIVLPRNAAFVGREEDLQRLAIRLKGGGTAAVGQVAAATGLGGIGKTQLAGEFVHRYGRFFAGGVFWLTFADPEAVESQVAGCGGPGALEL